MRTFTDSKEREWTLDLNLGVAYAFEQCKAEVQERLKETNPELGDVNLSLLDTSDKNFMKGITTTHCLLKLSWLCLEDRQGMTELEYLSGFKGDTIQEVKLVMMEELADFFPQQAILFLKLRDAQTKIVRKLEKLLKKHAPKMDEKLDQFFDQQVKELEDELGRGETSG